jgi:hypothetical protein
LSKTPHLTDGAALVRFVDWRVHHHWKERGMAQGQSA